MASSAAVRVRRTKRRITKVITGAATISIAARPASSTTITTTAATAVSRFWV